LRTPFKKKNLFWVNPLTAECSIDRKPKQPLADTRQGRLMAEQALPENNGVLQLLQMPGPTGLREHATHFVGAWGEGG
jgi:hypothetical protein